MIQHNQMPQQQTPQVMFDFVQGEMAAYNYLVAPGNTVYLLDSINKVLYEKNYQTMRVYDLTERELPKNQNGSGNTITREEIAQMIQDALHEYNPHIPKKERTNG